MNHFFDNAAAMRWSFKTKRKVELPKKMHKALNLFHCNSKVKVCELMATVVAFSTTILPHFAFPTWESVDATQSNL